MFDSDDDFDRALRVLRNAVGFVCCLASGALIAMAYGGWRLFAVLLLLYWPLLLAMDIGSRQNWYGRARGLLGRIRLLRAVDLVVAGLVLVGPTWIAQRFNLEIGPAALVLVLSAALAALWLEPAWQGVSVAAGLVLFEYFIVPPTDSFVFASSQDAIAFALASCAVVVMALGARTQAALSTYYA